MIYVGFLYQIDYGDLEQIAVDFKLYKEFYIVKAKNPNEAKRKVFEYWWNKLDFDSKEFYGYSGIDWEKEKEEECIIEKYGEVDGKVINNIIDNYSEIDLSKGDVFEILDEKYMILSDKSLKELSKLRVWYDIYISEATEL